MAKEVMGAPEWTVRTSRWDVWVRGMWVAIFGRFGGRRM
jgi:hypothetical protein